jgi:hypothetical protein
MSYGWINSKWFKSGVIFAAMGFFWWLTRRLNQPVVVTCAIFFIAGILHSRVRRGKL